MDVIAPHRRRPLRHPEGCLVPLPGNQDEALVCVSVQAAGPQGIQVYARLRTIASPEPCRWPSPNSVHARALESAGAHPAGPPLRTAHAPALLPVPVVGHLRCPAVLLLVGLDHSLPEPDARAPVKVRGIAECLQAVVQGPVRRLRCLVPVLLRRWAQASGPAGVCVAAGPGVTTAGGSEGSASGAAAVGLSTGPSHIPDAAIRSPRARVDSTSRSSWCNPPHASRSTRMRSSQDREYSKGVHQYGIEIHPRFLSPPAQTSSAPLVLQIGM